MSRKKKGGVRGKNKVQNKEKRGILSSIVWNPPVSENDPLYRKIFLVLAIVFTCITLLLALNAGVNADEKVHLGYTEVLMDYYKTFGGDKSAVFVDRGKMHYYGGFFDVSTGVLNGIFGFSGVEDSESYYKVRHFLNGLIGSLAMLFTALFAKEMGGWKAGVLGYILIFMSPRFLGHSLMNPRDIPFAAGYIISLYFISAILRKIPSVDWKLVLGLALGFGLAFGTRASALLILPYAGLFTIAAVFLRGGFQEVLKPSNYLPYAKPLGIAFLGGFIFAYAFWPFGQSSPVTNLFDTLTSFSNYRANIRMLFEGNLVWSRDLPLITYMLKWIGMTIPLVTVAGLVLWVGLYPGKWAKYPVLPVFMAVFALAFPLSYILYKQSTLYDGIRHLTFVFTPLSALATLGWVVLADRFTQDKIKSYMVYGLFGLLTLPSAWHIAKNSSLIYVYFNPISGGASNAFGNYEMDYWGLSMKNAMKWMDKEGIFDNATSENKVKIYTNFAYGLRTQNIKNKDLTETKYSRFRERYDQDWDYGIYVSRFIDGTQLSSGMWPSGRAIHTIDINGVPVCAIYQNLDKRPYLANQALKKNDNQKAIQLFSEEVAEYPGNDIAWKGLGTAYLNLKQFDKAINAFEGALKVNPGDATALNSLGIAALQGGNNSKAETAFSDAIKYFPNNFQSHYYLGLIYFNSNNLNGARISAENAVKLNPNFKQGLELLAQVYDKQGDKARANQIRQRLK